MAKSMRQKELRKMSKTKRNKSPAKSAARKEDEAGDALKAI
jgi:Protein of unknwon function (DUF3008)